jgi:acetoin utilization deacetylase AcuC-like enzyme
LRRPALPDGTQDAEYLRALQQALEVVFPRALPQFVIYLSGADPYAGDSDTVDIAFNTVSEAIRACRGRTERLPA